LTFAHSGYDASQLLAQLRSSAPMPPLLRTLRFRDLLLLFIGSVIGSGIFRTPGPILRQVDGSVGLSLLVWTVGGVLSLLGALTYAELAAANPEAGGLYCYIRDGFGRISAFFYGWCLFLVIASGSVAALARAFSEYFARIVPISLPGQTVVAVVVIGIVTAVNVWGTRKVRTFRIGLPSSRLASSCSSAPCSSPSAGTPAKFLPPWVRRSTDLACGPISVWR